MRIRRAVSRCHAMKTTGTAERYVEGEWRAGCRIAPAKNVALRQHGHETGRHDTTCRSTGKERETNVCVRACVSLRRLVRSTRSSLARGVLLPLAWSLIGSRRSMDFRDRGPESSNSELPDV
jgi:hypothetical protein